MSKDQKIWDKFVLVSKLYSGLVVPDNNLSGSRLVYQLELI